MASSEPSQAFTLPSTEIRMKRVGPRALMFGILLMVGPLLALALVFRLIGTNPPEYLIPLWVYSNIYVLWPTGILLLISGSTMWAVPRDPKWKQVLRLYTTRSTLQRPPSRASATFVQGSPDEALQVDAVLPDHHPEARAALIAELDSRGLSLRVPIPLVPNFVPPHDPGATRDIVLTGSQSLRSGGGAAIRFAVVIIAVGVALAAAVLIIGLLLQVPSERNYVVGVPGGAAVLAAFVAGCITMVVFPLTWMRRRPLRVLFLRKFNSKDLSKSYRKLTIRQLKQFGHVIGLSDRYIRDSWVRWLFRSNFVLGRYDPFVYAYKLLLVLPFTLVARLFDKVRFGPPTIRNARDYRRFCIHLTERKRMNLRCGWTTDGLFVRTSDEWWQLIALTLLVGSDVIVLDLSEPTEGVQWEIDTITGFQLWNRVVVICRRDRIEEATSRKDLFEKVWVYDEKGRMADRPGFEKAMLTAAHESVKSRWASSDAPALTTGSASGGCIVAAIAALAVAAVLAGSTYSWLSRVDKAAPPAENLQVGNLVEPAPDMDLRAVEEVPPPPPDLTPVEDAQPPPSDVGPDEGNTTAPDSDWLGNAAATPAQDSDWLGNGSST